MKELRRYDRAVINTSGCIYKPINEMKTRIWRQLLQYIIPPIYSRRICKNKRRSTIFRYNHNNITMHPDDSIAATVVAITCGIGLLFNSASIYVTHRSKNFQSSFGIICAGVCIINSIVLLIILCWTTSVLIFADIDETSILAIACGQIANAMYYASVAMHTLISFNRFCAIYFPTKYARLFGRKESIYEVIGICILTLLMTSGLYFDECGYLFKAETYRWGYQNTPCGHIYQISFNIVYTVLMLGTMTVVDLFTLQKLRHFSKQFETKTIVTAQTNEQKFITRKKQLAFFVQVTHWNELICRYELM
uniref:G-protein coupled receptors family 1 profile domain-containing protein n=2 Tax=Parascaris univalens TaxID=6257 RepID=A0A915B125_PARUN